MLLSVENWHTRRAYGDMKAIEIIADAGFDGIDFSFNDMYDWEKVMESQDSLDYARTLRTYAKEYGICFSQAHAPLRFRYGMKFTQEEREFRYITKSMEFAAELGVPILVVHGIDTPRYADVFEYNLEFYRALLPYCEKYGVKVGVENLFEFYADGVITATKFGTPDSFNKMLEILDNPYYVGCVDVGHAKLTGHAPGAFIRAVEKHVQCLHLHGNDGILDSHNLPYLAPFDWEDTIQALKDIHYKGNFNFELIGYLGKFPKELLPVALKLAAATGRYLISKLEK